MADTQRETVQEILRPPVGHDFNWENNLLFVNWVNACDSIDDLNMVIARTQDISLAHKAAITRRQHLQFLANDSSGKQTLRWAKVAAIAAIIGVLIGLVQIWCAIFVADDTHKPRPIQTPPEPLQMPVSIVPPQTNAIAPQAEQAQSPTQQPPPVVEDSK